MEWLYAITPPRSRLSAPLLLYAPGAPRRLACMTTASPIGYPARYAFRESRRLLSAVRSACSRRWRRPARPKPSHRAQDRPRGARDFATRWSRSAAPRRDADGRYANSRTPPNLDRNIRATSRELIHFRPGSIRIGACYAGRRRGAPQSNTNQTGSYAAVYSRPEALENFVKGMTGGSRRPQGFAKNSLSSLRSPGRLGTSQGCLPGDRGRALTRRHRLRPADDPGRFRALLRAHGLEARASFHARLSTTLSCRRRGGARRILHNWDLPTKTMLLPTPTRRCRRVAPPSAMSGLHRRRAAPTRRHG